MTNGPTTERMITVSTEGVKVGDQFAITGEDKRWRRRLLYWLLRKPSPQRPYLFEVTGIVGPYTVQIRHIPFKRCR